MHDRREIVQQPESSSAEKWTNRELIERMRESDPRAFREFFMRFELLLQRYAVRYRVQPALRGEVVIDTLDNAVLALLRPTSAIPQSLEGYLVRSLRRHSAETSRGELRRPESAATLIEKRESRDAASLHARAVGEQYNVLQSQVGEMPLDPVLERLASLLDEGMTEAERSILSWVSHWVPQRTIAQWVGVSHSAIRVRIWRLRDRLRAVAVQHAMQVSPDERRELEDFFRRAAIAYPANSTRQGAIAETNHGEVGAKRLRSASRHRGDDT